MRKMKSLFVALLLVAGASSAYAGCLSDYNAALLSCDSGGFGFFTRTGCKADSLVAYYGCILDIATS